MPDHVHMLVSIPPKISVANFMGYLKGKSSLMIFDKHANLKYKFGNRKFWAEGYYVSTVGLRSHFIAVRLRGNKKVQNLSSMWYKKLPQQLATQGDFGLEPSYYTLLSTAIPDTGTCF